MELNIFNRGLLGENNVRVETDKNTFQSLIISDQYLKVEIIKYNF